MENLKQVFFKLQEANPALIAGGSFAMRLQNINTPREPGDLDVTLPFGVLFNAIKGLEYRHVSDGDEYFNDEFNRTSWTLDGIKVDVFMPANDLFKQRTTEVFTSRAINHENADVEALFINCVHWSECMRQKILYALNDHKSATKHMEDIAKIIELNRHPINQ